MPTSDHRQISTVLDLVLKREPHSILDIGVGYGKYGTLLREYLPDARIVGVEPWAKYGDLRDDGDGDRWESYDAMLMQPWPNMSAGPTTLALAGRDIFDVALMIDVIEHYPSHGGMQDLGGQSPGQLDALYAACRVARAVIVATPHNAMQWPQDDLPNPLEKHYPAPTINHLAYMAGKSDARLVECHWLPDSYVAVVERIEQLEAADV